jgi:hypothetical protein
VHIEPSPLSDVTAIAPRRFLDAWYVEESYAEGFGKIDLDYLDPETRARYAGSQP